MRLLPLLLLLGCAGPPAEPAPDLGPTVDRVLATLEESARLDRDRRDAEARIAWRRAHQLFEADLEPHLRAALPSREVALTEYLFGRVRSEIDQAKGKPRTATKELEERLRTQAAAIRPPDVVAMAPQG